jgi:rubrerythrin
MNWEQASFASRSARHDKALSRRKLLATGAMVGMAGVSSIPLTANRSIASDTTDQRNDAEILNNALLYEHAAIWAYTVAAGRLTNTSVGQAVMAIAIANKTDHENHRNILMDVVTSLDATPLTAESSYDISPYLNNGEGNLESDVNIAKLALALEVDAAIAYGKEVARLKTPALITAGTSIGSTEASHATLIRAAFKSLGVDLAVIPVSFVSEDTRDAWVLKV